jgi:hypothetical protein
MSPFPFNALGSGPVQLWIMVISVILGITLLGLGFAIKRKI